MRPNRPPAPARPEPSNEDTGPADDRDRLADAIYRTRSETAQRARQAEATESDHLARTVCFTEAEREAIRAKFAAAMRKRRQQSSDSDPYAFVVAIEGVARDFVRRAHPRQTNSRESLERASQALREVAEAVSRLSPLEGAAIIGKAADALARSHGPEAATELIHRHGLRRGVPLPWGTPIQRLQEFAELAVLLSKGAQEAAYDIDTGNADEFAAPLALRLRETFSYFGLKSSATRQGLFWTCLAGLFRMVRIDASVDYWADTSRLNRFQEEAAENQGA